MQATQAEALKCTFELRLSCVTRTRQSSGDGVVEIVHIQTEDQFAGQAWILMPRVSSR